MVMRTMAMRLLLIALSMPALAAGPADAAGTPAAGRAIADRWCSNCHVVGPGSPGGDAAPPFATIAADPGLTPERIRGWLSASHTRMPDFGLTPHEIDDLNAYLASLPKAR
jgi:mono/diheme cytochrome c family protein